MKDLINFLSGRLGIQNKALLEKDIILHRILIRLMQSQFKDEYAFKGGTCLIKCYLGYYRFSEDLDFTYINQAELADKSQKEIRRILSKKIIGLASLLSSIAHEISLNFKEDRSDNQYIELGGSNKFATFKLWYASEILQKEQFVKIQINFVELFKDKIIQNKALSLYSGIPAKEMELLFPEYIDLLKEIPLKSYSLKEILFEKVRAILTRRGLKSRDFIDVYLIMQNKGFNLKNEEKNIIEKIRFMLRYDKYLQNLSSFDFTSVVHDEEEKLLLKPVDGRFKNFLKEFQLYLRDIIAKVR